MTTSTTHIYESFTLKDPNYWETLKAANQDDVGKAILRFAARWANRMEKGMSEGKDLEDIAESSEVEANDDNISGAMYRPALNTLIRVWAHGNELRDWNFRREQWAEFWDSSTPWVEKLEILHWLVFG